MNKPTCPFCNSTNAELFSLYGQTLLGSQYYCNDCRSVFEAIRFDDEQTRMADEHEQEEVQENESEI